MTDTMKIEILGTGCKKCQQLEANAREAVAARNLTAEVEHITDMMQIVERGVMATPDAGLGCKRRGGLPGQDSDAR